MLSLLCISKDLLNFGLMKRAFIVVLLLLAWVPGYCQFFQKIDNWLRQRQSKQAYDTTCIYSQVKAYYAFNGGRFSLPAAVTQAYRQRRSADSLLFMGEDDASMLMGRLKSSANLTAGIRF